MKWWAAVLPSQTPIVLEQPQIQVWLQYRGAAGGIVKWLLLVWVCVCGCAGVCECGPAQVPLWVCTSLCRCVGLMWFCGCVHVCVPLCWSVCGSALVCCMHVGVWKCAGLCVGVWGVCAVVGGSCALACRSVCGLELTEGRVCHRPSPRIICGPGVPFSRLPSL